MMSNTISIFRSSNQMRPKMLRQHSRLHQLMLASHRHATLPRLSSSTKTNASKNTESSGTILRSGRDLPRSIKMIAIGGIPVCNHTSCRRIISGGCYRAVIQHPARSGGKSILNGLHDSGQIPHGISMPITHRRQAPPRQTHPSTPNVRVRFSDAIGATRPALNHTVPPEPVLVPLPCAADPVGELMWEGSNASPAFHPSVPVPHAIHPASCRIASPCQSPMFIRLRQGKRIQARRTPGCGFHRRRALDCQQTKKRHHKMIRFQALRIARLHSDDEKPHSHLENMQARQYCRSYSGWHLHANYPPPSCSPKPGASKFRSALAGIIRGTP